MNEVVVVEAIRTPSGAYKGSLKKLSADKLGSIVIREILRKSKDKFKKVLPTKFGGGKSLSILLFILLV